MSISADNPLVQEALRLIVTASEQKFEHTRPATREAQNRQIAELFDLGYSRVEIARRLQMNRETVTNRLKRMEAGQ